MNYSKVSGLGTNNIHGLYLDGNELWCGSFDNGIEIFDIEKRKVIRSYKADDGISGLNSNFVFTICRMKDGYIWVGTDRGVQQLDKTTGTFKNVFPDIALCNYLFQDSRRNIWCVTGNGLYCITDDGKQKKYNLGARSVQAVMETTDGQIWATTTEGIAHLDQKKGDFTVYSLSDLNAATNYTYRIVEDGQGYFGFPLPMAWFASILLRVLLMCLQLRKGCPKIVLMSVLLCAMMKESFISALSMALRLSILLCFCPVKSFPNRGLRS